MKAKTYHEWFLSHREKLMAELAEKGGRTKETDEAMTVEVVRYSHLKNYILSGENQPDILIACDDDGEPAEYAVPMIRAFFAEHPDINMVYGDEDQVTDGVHIHHVGAVGSRRLHVCRLFISGVFSPSGRRRWV